MQNKVLYIHGFNGSPNGTTGSFVKSFFSDDIVVASNFDLLDYEGTLSKIKKIIDDNDINIIVSHSFGSFYTIALNDDETFKILINPCMFPSIEIPPLSNPPLDTEWIEEFQKKETEIYSQVNGLVSQTTFAIFGNNDELFSYYETFNEYYGTSSLQNKKNSIVLPGTHRLSNNSLERGLACAIDYSSVFENIMKG